MSIRQKITALMIWGCFMGFRVLSQSNITRVEYFFNTDPGFGLANPIPITPNINIQNFAANIPVTALSPGLNTLFIRSANALSKWSITNWFLFLKTSLPPAANITAAEYFIDADPGFGAATVIPVTAGTNVPDVPVAVNISSKNPGLHTLFLRSKDANGKWSITNTFLFLKTTLSPAPNITGAEYFIDKDPGFGNAVSIPIANNPNAANLPVAVNVAASSQGLHTLFLRSKDANGKWSITNSFLFYKTSNTLYNITEAEYFIDKDPGFGAGTKISQIPQSVKDSNVNVTIDITAVDTGNHEFFIRSKDAFGKWSITNYLHFYKDRALPVTLLSFEATPLQNEVLLQWKTVTEENSNYFEIEFSSDAIAFSAIGKVAATGNSVTVSSYEFTHTRPNLNGSNYYRIKELDKDGRFTYSPLRTVKFSNKTDFVINPNPVRNNLTVYSKEKDLLLHIFDNAGKNLLTQKINNYTTLINFSSFANGMYYLIAEKDGKPLYIRKIVKQ